MPAFYVIDKDRKAVFSSGKGMLTAADLMGHQERILKDPEFDPTYSQLLDFSGITEIEITSEDVRRLAQKNVFSSDSRRAFVVQDDLQYGLAECLKSTAILPAKPGSASFAPSTKP